MSSTSKTAILYTGATGYLGGSVLQRILSHPKASTFDITLLVRNAQKARELETTLGLKVALGSLQDVELLAKLAEDADVVMHMADADDEGAMKAILKGLKNRHDKRGERPILIHTSGTGVLVDDARGSYCTPTVVSDLDLPALAALPPTALHHTVDLLATDADARDGYVRAYLVFPGVVYGAPRGPLFDTGIAHAHTVQLPVLARGFLKRGRAGLVGTGACRWPDVHIDDNAEVYYLLLDAVLRDPESVSHGRAGYFFVENGEHSLYDLCAAFGEALVAHGHAEHAAPTVLSPEERLKIFRSDAIAYLHFSNARCRADRARKELGWKPTHTTEDLFKAARAEVEAVVAKA